MSTISLEVVRQPAVTLEITAPTQLSAEVQRTELGLHLVAEQGPMGPRGEVGTTGAKGDPGSVGEMGPPGPAGTLEGTFDEAFPEALAWTVNHNLGRYPLVGVLTTGGAEVDADILHISANQLAVYFAVPFGGRIRCV